MPMFPHTVTICNTRQETDKATFEDRESCFLTVLEGVLLEERRGAKISRDGLDGADAATLTIPFDAAASDAQTGAEKTYISPEAFWALEDKTGHWTLGAGQDTWIIKGRAACFHAAGPAKKGVYAVTRIDIRDFGSAGMRHFTVGAK